ncbi:MAG: hypothetical protein ACTSO9_15135 [Candidatus Helarchaeota archaeon]
MTEKIIEKVSSNGRIVKKEQLLFIRFLRSISYMIYDISIRNDIVSEPYE